MLQRPALQPGVSMPSGMPVPSSIPGPSRYGGKRLSAAGTSRCSSCCTVPVPVSPAPDLPVLNLFLSFFLPPLPHGPERMQVSFGRERPLSMTRSQERFRPHDPRRTGARVAHTCMRSVYKCVDYEMKNPEIRTSIVRYTGNWLR